jgi:hypothetical protein
MRKRLHERRSCAGVRFKQCGYGSGSERRYVCHGENFEVNFWFSLNNVSGTGCKYDHETGVRTSNWAEQQPNRRPTVNRGGGSTCSLLLLLLWMSLTCWSPFRTKNVKGWVSDVRGDDGRDRSPILFIYGTWHVSKYGGHTAIERWQKMLGGNNNAYCSVMKVCIVLT